MNKKFVVYGIVMTLLLCVGMSYAYFTGMISGEGKEIRVSAKELRILFTDDMELASSEIIPGWKETKTFSVKNESGNTFNYNIVINDLVNTFATEGYLQYKITSSNGYNMSGYLDIPKSITPEDIILAYDIDIEAGVTQEYTIEFIYHDSDEDQSEDMGKVFSGTLGIIEGTINPTIKYKVTLEMENATITSANPQETIKNGSVEFNISLNEGYTLDNSVVVCDGNAEGSIEGNKIKIDKVVRDQTCTLTTEKINYNLTMNITGGTIKPANVMVAHGESGEFTITASTGYTLDNPTITCTGGASHTLNGSTITISAVISTQTCNVVLKELPKSLKDKILADHPTRPGVRPNLNSDIYQDENTGTLYTANGNITEGGSTVYYFSGNAQDNWIYFAGIYWRIIRINEDGSVRLLYVGQDKNTTSGYIATSVYNKRYDDPMYVGYKYGSSGTLASNRTNATDSTIKGIIDTWYNSTIKPSYNDYISKTAVYCNDRANEGYSTTVTFNYAANKRLVDSKVPSYKCGNNASGNLYTGTNGADIADKFTSSTTTGNGKLTNPVSLMTADEAAFAGGRWATQSQAYYYYNASGGSVTGSSWWWTLTPNYYNTTTGNNNRRSRVFFINGTNAPGTLDSASVYYDDGTVRPVLSLKSCVKWKSGNGTSDNPYTVDTLDSVCSSAEN